MKKNLTKLLQTMIVMSLIFTSFAFNRQSEIKAKDIEGIHIDMQWSGNKKDEPYRPGDKLSFLIDWSLDDDSNSKSYHEGDSFSLSLPDGLEFVMTSIPLRDDTGVVVAKGVPVDGKMVFTFTKEIEQKISRNGHFTMDYRIAPPEKEGIQDIPLDFKDGFGNPVLQDKIKVEYEHSEGPTSEVFYKGAMGTQTEEGLDWYIRVNQTYGIRDDEVVISDFVGEGHEIMEDSIRISAQPYLSSENVIESLPSDEKPIVKVADDLKSFEITLKSVPHYFYTIYYSTRYTGNYEEDLANSNQGKIKLENTARAQGNTSGNIPMNSNEEGKPVQGDFNLGGWAEGKNRNGTFIVEKVDAVTGEKLPGVTFELRHQIDDSIPTLSAVTNDEGQAIFTVSKTGLYQLTELEPLEGYLGIEPMDVLLKYGPNETQTFEVKNSLKPINLTVEKIWQDENGETIPSPKNVTFQLFGNDKLVRKAVLAQGEKELVFKNLPVLDKDGNQIRYKVEELPIEGFETSVEEKSNVLSVVTNKIKTKNIKVSKKWEDASGNAISPLENISIVLEKTVEGKTIQVDQKELTKDQSSITFSNLPERDSKGNKIEYMIKEISSKNYAVSIDKINDEEYEITNKVKINKIELEVNKKWLNAENNAMEAKQDIEIELFKNGKKVDSKVLKKGETSLKFTDLDDKEVDGTPIKYSVREVALENFNVDYDTNDSKTTITNTYIVPKTSIEGTKVWKDLTGKEIESHSSIEVILLANGEEVDRIELEQGKKDFQFKDIPLTDINGNPIKYEIQEVDINGFTSHVDFNSEDFSVTITNTKDIEYTDIKGEKIWFDVSGHMLDQSEQADITIQLLRDGKVHKTITLEKGQYDFNFKNLPKTNEKGVPYTYSIQEIEVEGFHSFVSFDEETNKFVISNKKNTEYFNLEGNKIWLGLDGKETDPQAEITVDLYANDERVDTRVLSHEETSFTFENLPRTDENGQAIEYRVSERELEGFTSKVEMKEDHVTITNTQDVEYFNLEGNKIWLGLDGKETDPQAEITVDLYANDERVDTRVLSQEETSFTFENLPRTDENGQAIEYRVSERELEGFTSKVEMKQDHVTITNRQDVEYFNLEGNKIWLGLDGKETDPQAEITVDLYANDERVDTRVLSQEETIFTFENLPRTDENGQAIEYRVSERELEGFTSKVEMKQDHVTITNTQDIEYFNLEGNKVWLGLDGKAMDSKETITIELYANGSLVSKQILEKGDYDFVFSDLPKTDEKGERIHYTISEVEVEGYESSITYDEEAGTYLIVNKEIEPEVPSKPEEPKPEEVEEISVEPGVVEPEEIEEVLTAHVLPQTGQGVSSAVYMGFTGVLLGLYLVLRNRKKGE